MHHSVAIQESFMNIIVGQYVAATNFARHIVKTFEIRRVSDKSLYNDTGSNKFPNQIGSQQAICSCDQHLHTGNFWRLAMSGFIINNASFF